LLLTVLSRLSIHHQVQRIRLRYDITSLRQCILITPPIARVPSVSYQPPSSHPTASISAPVHHYQSLPASASTTSCIVYRVVANLISHERNFSSALHALRAFRHRIIDNRRLSPPPPLSPSSQLPPFASNIFN
jgi:hypothetical protein